MSGPAAEIPRVRQKNGRIVYRCLSGHFHAYPEAAWSCGGPSTKEKP